MQLLLPSFATPQTGGSAASSELGSSDGQSEGVEFFGVWFGIVDEDGAFSLPVAQGQPPRLRLDEEGLENLDVERLETEVSDVADEEDLFVNDGQLAPAVSRPPVVGERGSLLDSKTQLVDSKTQLESSTNETVVRGGALQDQFEEVDRGPRGPKDAIDSTVRPETPEGDFQPALPQVIAVKNARSSSGVEGQARSVPTMPDAGVARYVDVPETVKPEPNPNLNSDNLATAPQPREAESSIAAIGGSSVAVATAKPLEPVQTTSVPEARRQQQVVPQTPQLASAPVLTKQLAPPDYDSTDRRNRSEKIDRLIAPSQSENTAQFSTPQVSFQRAQSSQQVTPFFADGPPIVTELISSAADDVRGSVARELEVAQKMTTADRTRAEPSIARSVVVQIMHTVTRSSAEGVIEVRLQPEELGRVRLTMVSGEAGFTVQVTAERPDTLDLIRRNIELLENDLRDRGFADMNFSFGGEHQSDTPSFDGDEAPDRSMRDGHEDTRLMVDLTAPDVNTYNVTLDIRV